MGNIVGSFVSGFIKVVGDLLGAPLDFLSGKSCSSVCSSTWDLVCYIENFCIANLLKMLCVLVLLYIVLLFFYLLYKIGICHCIGKGMCKMLWACLTSCFSICKYGCMSLWFKSKNLKRMNEEHLRDIDDYYDSTTSNDDRGETTSYTHNPRSLEFRKLFSQRSRERRRIHLERSLRPRSHRIRVGISYMNSNERDRKEHHHRHADALHNIKVIHTSKFVQKGNPKRIHFYRKW